MVVNISLRLRPREIFQKCNTYILLHDREGNTRRYSVLGPAEGRDDTKVDNGIFPPTATPRHQLVAIFMKYMQSALSLRLLKYLGL